jgi:hypothetical protein
MQYSALFLRPMLCLTLLAGTMACSQPLTPAVGGLSFRLAAGQPARGLFGLKAVPATTRSFRIVIAGAGLSAPRVLNIPVTNTSEPQTHTVPDLPIGSKRVVVTAFDQEQALASATQELTIKAAETTRAEFELRPSLFNLELRLPQALPVEIGTQATFRGEPFLSEVTRTARFVAGNNRLSFRDLPAGELSAAVTLSLQVNNREWVSAAIPLNIKAAAGEAVVRALSVEEIALAFSTRLQSLNKSERLAVLRALPADLLALLRRYSEWIDLLLKTDLPLPIASPTPTPTPVPSNEPQPAPSGLSDLIPANSLRMELLTGRVALRAVALNENPDTLVDSLDPTLITLQANSVVQIMQGSDVHAAVVRLAYTGKDIPQGSVRVQNLDNPAAPINSRSFQPMQVRRGVLPYRFHALTWLIDDDLSPLTLSDAARYQITIVFKGQAGTAEEKVLESSFVLEVLPP